MPRRGFPLLAIAIALLAAGCGQSNPKLIAQTDADKLTSAVDSIQQACGSGDATTVRDRTQQARDLVDGLPRKVDKSLKQNLNDWIDQVDKRAGRDCKGATATATATDTPTATATETATPTATATATPTETPTATPTPTETPTATPSATPSATATPTPDSGGTQAPGNGDSGGTPGPGVLTPPGGTTP